MDMMLVSLVFHCVIEAGRSSSQGPDNFLSYNFATGIVQGYLSERPALVNVRNLTMVSAP